MNTTEYREWHDPRNGDCLHNIDATIPCICKKQRVYKPYRVVRVNDPEAPHGIGKLVFHIWPHGLIEIREHGRRKSFSTLAGKLYQTTVASCVRAEKAAKKKGKKKLVARR